MKGVEFPAGSHCWRRGIFSRESLGRLEELEIEIGAFHGADELERQLQAHAGHPELIGTPTLTDLTHAARALEAGGASSDEEVVKLSKTISEILESGESTSARLDEHIEAAEKMAIDAYVQIYGVDLREVFDIEVLRNALLAINRVNNEGDRKSSSERIAQEEGE